MEKYLKFLFLVAGLVVAIVFGLTIPAAPTATTEDVSLFVPLFAIVLMPYSLALLVYVLLRKQFKPFVKELFLHFVLVSVILVFVEMFQSGVPVKMETVMLHGMYGWEEGQYSVYPNEWRGNCFLFLIPFVYWWHLFYYRTSSERLTASYFLPLLFFSQFFIAIDYIYRNY